MKRPPHPSLREYITHYWHITGPAGQYAQMIIPNGYARLCFFRASGATITLGFLPRRQKTHHQAPPPPQPKNVHLLKPGSKYHVAYLAGELDMVIVEYTLLGSYLIRELQDGHPAIEQLSAQIMYAPSPEAIDDILNRFHLDILAGQRRDDPNIARLSQIQQLISMECLCDLNQMAEMACVSGRQLSRIFRDNIGITPSDLISLCRYRMSVRAIHTHREVPLWQTAVECGYSNLSHMTRDYIRITGHSPGQILSDIKAYTEGTHSGLFLTTQYQGTTYMCNLV